MADGPGRRDFAETSRLGFVVIPCSLEPLIELAFKLSVKSDPVTLRDAAQMERVAKTIREATFPQRYDET